VQGPQGAQGSRGTTGPQGPQGFQASDAGSFVNGSYASYGVNTPAGPQGTLRATGEITAFASDVRLKKDIYEINDCLEKIKSICGVYYTHNKTAQRYGYQDLSQKVGLIAQQVLPILPEVVYPAPFDVDKNGASSSGEKYLTIDYEKLVPVIVQAIKQQQQLINDIMADLDQVGDVRTWL